MSGTAVLNTETERKVKRVIGARLFRRWLIRLLIGYAVVMTVILVYLFAFSGWSADPSKAIQKITRNIWPSKMTFL